MAMERNKCSECGFHLPKCMCTRVEAAPMNESFWATAYDKFDRWKRAQWLFYTMVSK